VNDPLPENLPPSGFNLERNYQAGDDFANDYVSSGEHTLRWDALKRIGVGLGAATEGRLRENYFNLSIALQQFIRKSSFVNRKSIY